MFPDEQKIISEADAWYGKWIRALPKYGKDDAYWSKVIEIAGRFAEDNGLLGRALMLNRMEELEKEWSRLNGS